MDSNTNTEAAPPMSPKPASIQSGASDKFINSYDPKAYGIFDSNLPFLVDANKFLPENPLRKVQFWDTDALRELSTEKWSEGFWFIAGEGAGDVERIVDPDQAIIKDPINAVFKEESQNWNPEEILKKNKGVLTYFQGILVWKRKIGTLRSPRLFPAELDAPNPLIHWIAVNDVHKLVEANRDRPGNPLRNIEIWRPDDDYAFGLPLPYWKVDGDLKSLVDPYGALRSTGIPLEYWHKGEHITHPDTITDDKVHIIIGLNGAPIGKCTRAYLGRPKTSLKNKWRPLQIFGRYVDLKDDSDEESTDDVKKAAASEIRPEGSTDIAVETTGQDERTKGNTDNLKEVATSDDDPEEKNKTGEEVVISDEDPKEKNKTEEKTIDSDKPRNTWIAYDDIPKLLIANQGLPGTPLRNVEIWRPGYTAEYTPIVPYFIVSGDVKDLIDPDKVLVDVGTDYPWNITDTDVKFIKSFDNIVVGQPVPDGDLRQHKSTLLYDPRPSGITEFRDDQFEIPLPKFKPGEKVWYDPYVGDPEKEGKHLVEVEIIEHQGWSKPSGPVESSEP